MGFLISDAYAQAGGGGGGAPYGDIMFLVLLFAVFYFLLIRPQQKRAKEHKTVLALQDTSYFVYTSHPKTEGLGKMSMKKGKNVKKIYSNGLMMHTCLAVTTDGLPLGLLDQKIFSRKLRTRKTGKAKPHDHLPIEEKESYRWLETLENTKAATGDTEIVTVCDREADD